MKRLSLIGSWKRLGVQVGLLAGVGIAFIGGSEPPPVEAAPICLMEGQCTFVKPLFMIIADYSTSMNTQFAPMKTRWQSAVDAIVTMVDSQNGYLPGNVLLGLMRFGHDPNAAQMGTTIPNDASGIVDGQKIDVGFYDPNDANKKYYECNGEAIKTAITAVPPPINGNLTGIGTWTKGALDRAKAYFAQTKADHPNDKGDRRQAIVLLTDGEWTDPSGTMKLTPMNQNPAITAKDLWDNQMTPTYVVAIGEAMGKMFADELANNGGTGQAIDAMNPDQLVMALQQVVEDIKQQVIQPVCTPGLPRLMVLLDASSSMLNVQGGTMYGSQGMTGWDQARAALAGTDSLFDQQVNAQMQEVQNLVHLGLAVFGHNMPNPGEQKILVDYGPCMKDNFAWALDPQSSCVAPGCTDPWGGPPITWTFQDGSQMNPPGFDAQTLSHMPKCDKSNQAPFQNACIGSGTYTHLGLQLVQQNIAAYKAKCADPNFAYPCSAMTKYINILVTDGVYNSTDAQVQAPLEQMYMGGTKTYVIGFGDLVNTNEAILKLQNMAKWGSGGTEMYYDANDQMQLQAALASIIEEITFDPCCSFNNCEQNPEPTTIDPDPLPGSTGEITATDTDAGTDTDISTGTESGTSSTTNPTSETDATTVNPTTETEGTTNNPTTGETTATPTEGTPTSTTDDTTGTNTTPGNTTPATSESESESDGSTGNQATGDGTPVDDGCGCSVDDKPAQGLLASLFSLGLAGFFRRRRRAA